MSDCENLIRIICCGNHFRGDDAAGLEVYKQLKKETFPNYVEIIEGGILGVNLLPLFRGCGKVILVDSILMNENPGHLQWFTMADVLETKSARVSIHEINPLQLMSIWHQLNGDAVLLNILLLGIVIEEPIYLTDKISNEIQRSAVTAVDEIKRKIRSFAANGEC